MVRTAVTSRGLRRLDAPGRPLASAPASALLVRLLCIVVGVALSCSAFVRPAAAADEVIERVLAVAGGDVITLSDVRAALELGRVQRSADVDPTRTVVSQLIDRALVLAEVDRFAPPEPSALAIEAAVEGVVARFSSRAEFDATLGRLGIDERSVHELLREDLRIRAYLDQRFVAQTPDEQQSMVAEWIAGLRRRSEVIDLYGAPVSAPVPGTAGSARR